MKVQGALAQAWQGQPSKLVRFRLKSANAVQGGIAVILTIRRLVSGEKSKH
jgi:hypothetical protein